MESQDIFTRVSTRNERERVYKILVREPVEILCQLGKRPTLKVQAKDVVDSFLVVSHLSGPKISDSSNVILTFLIDVERFFIQTTIAPYPNRPGEFLIDVRQDLFKLQRRETFRVSLPPDEGYEAEVIMVEGRKIGKWYNVHDLSGGGFGFDVDVAAEGFLAKIGQKMDCILHLGGDVNFPAKATVRNIRTIGSAGSGIQRVGVQFINLDIGHQQQVMKTVMTLHREMFSKFKLAR